MVSNKQKLTRAERRKRAFATAAKAHIARRFTIYPADFRNRVVEAALHHWPEELSSVQRNSNVNRIFNDRRFRRELGLSPIAWWLLSLAVKAILSALIDYWFTTQNPTPPHQHKEHNR